MKNKVGEFIGKELNSSSVWCSGKMTKITRNYTRKSGAILKMIETVGNTQQFNAQVKELENQKIVEVKYSNVNTTVEQITFKYEQADKLFSYIGMENKRKQVEQYMLLLDKEIQQIKCEWLLTYMQNLYEKLKRGIIDDNLKDYKIIKILKAIAELNEEVWKRKFSYDVLGDSKSFENNYQDKIITVLINYSSKINLELKEDLDKENIRDISAGKKNLILAEHGILTYSQTLQLKGGIIYKVSEALEIDTSAHLYGTIINAQSLMHAELLSLKQVKKIVTIENQANYEDALFDENVLYIYTHGFFSPKEMKFLKQIQAIAHEDVVYEHWSDLDYGGIRIFQFIKKNIFPKLKPLYMEKELYEKLCQENVSGNLLTASKREKMLKMDVGELEALKQAILEHGIEYEQEALINYYEV